MTSIGGVSLSCFLMHVPHSTGVNNERIDPSTPGGLARRPCDAQCGSEYTPTQVAGKGQERRCENLRRRFAILEVERKEVDGKRVRNGAIKIETALGEDNSGGWRASCLPPFVFSPG